MMAAFVLMVSVGFALPNYHFVRSREVVSRNACVANLKQLEGAKATWALEFHKTGSDTPTDSDIFGPDNYIRIKSACPQGGIYRLGAVNEKPTCSIDEEGHTCP